MASPEDGGMDWSEDSSRRFIERGRIYTPRRDQVRETLLDLIPAERDEPFLAVELGVGSGWLSAALLERFPAARILGLDGSPAMLREAANLLQPFTGRFELRPFRLEDRSWLAGVGEGVRCFLSSLAIHHLDADGKRALYRDLYSQLEPGGAVLIADIVAPRSEWERRCLARWYDAEVRAQSLALTGSLDAYRQFIDDEWNWFAYPDPMDKPSAVPDHLQWLSEAGFAGASVSWQRAGHAVYGGYKGAGAWRGSGDALP